MSVIHPASGEIISEAQVKGARVGATPGATNATATPVAGAARRRNARAMGWLAPHTTIKPPAVGPVGTRFDGDLSEQNALLTTYYDWKAPPCRVTKLAHGLVHLGGGTVKGSRSPEIRAPGSAPPAP